MANEKVTQLPTVASATLSDIIYAVQSGTSSQETLQQVFNLMLANMIIPNAGNPNGVLPGVIYQLCWDTTNRVMYTCTTTGSMSTAVWTQLGIGFTQVATPAQGGTGISNPTAHTIPIAEGVSNYNFLGPLTNGQLLIGSTAADPVATTLTAGTNISITNAAGSITIASAGAGGFSWTHVTTTTQAMSPFNGYVADNAALVTLTLPTVATFGSTLVIVGKGAGGWSIAQNSGQNIVIGSSTSTTGVGGSVSSTNQTDAISLVCTVANTTWSLVAGAQGNITVV